MSTAAAAKVVPDPVDPVVKPDAPAEVIRADTTPAECRERLQSFIASKKLENFYTDVTDALANRAATLVNELRKKGCSWEMANQFALLTLYDLAILIDDSDSMKYDEGGVRIKTLQKILNNIADVYGLARENGIVTVRFINAPQGKKNVTPKTVRNVIKNHNYGGVTRIGTELKKKIIDKFVSENMEKPLLIMVITDGAAEGESKTLLETVIINTIAALDKHPMKGPQSVAFQFSRVGNDPGAQILIQELDDHPKVGQYVDCLPVTNRLEDIKKPEKKWVLMSKLLLGAISDYWDAADDELGDDQELVEAKVVNNSDVEDDENVGDITDDSD